MNETLIDRLIETLVEMGLSVYEARAYAALLTKSPTTRYELAKLAGVPSPKIYEAVQRLYEKGFVNQTAGEVPLVTPLEPDVLVARLRQRQERSLARLSDTLDQIRRSHEQHPSNDIWSLAGVDAAFGKAIEIIARCQDSLYLAAFAPDLMAMERAVTEAVERGIAVKVLSYGASTLHCGSIVEHGDAEGIIQRTGGRWLAMVRDRIEVLVSYPLDGDCESVWTNSPVFSLIISKYIDEHFFGERPISRGESHEEVHTG